MIQEIGPQKLFNEYTPPAAPPENSVVFSIRRRGRAPEFLAGLDNGRLRFPLLSEIPARILEAHPLQYLFRIDDTPFYMFAEQTEGGVLQPEEGGLQPEAGVLKPEIIGSAPVGSGFHYTYQTVRALRRGGTGTKAQMFAAFTAYHLSGWYYDNQFCGTCGNRVRHSASERAMVCPSCGRKIYPRLQPAVIVAVTDGDRIILTRYADRPVTHYALIAGFTEIGETLEETVAREVMEEVGLKVHNIRYFKSQPWGIADDILSGYW